MSIRVLLSLITFFAPFCELLLAADQAPIKALYITGGGYHDYKTLTPLLTSSIAKHANVTFTIVNNIEGMKNPDFAKDYDVVIYNMCFADQEVDLLPIENAKRAISEGTPALMVHCAMHCFRKGDEWASCCGLLTKHHDGRRGFSTTKSLPEHPIAKAFPADWSTPEDELYQNIHFPDTSVPVLLAHSIQSKKDHVVAWVHTLGKGRVFGTTLGHDTRTCGDENYHRLLAHGLLWSCGKLGDDGTPTPGFEGSDKK
jgi:type 1 glutamine amidotransferase